ncbi:hypothetical protein MOF34_12935 [Bacillus sp. T17B1]|uniref:hypothetical protein n=1 Tax=Bacillus sp. T17B1 TaxID=2918911 RepID=UPI002280EC63|nr:hypothetical protein [Bacillus sp. T17B1]
MKRIRIPMTLVLGAPLTIPPLSFASAEENSAPSIWVFEDGSFTNKGDGGWINWAFRGWFDRDDSTVETHRP